MGAEQMIPEAARKRIKDDPIFATGGKAAAAIVQLGKDKVVNGTVGVLLDDDNQLVTLKTVEEAAQRLSLEDVSRYAPISGLPSFLADVPDYVMGEKHKVRQPETCVATAGATGALRMAVWNFLEPGDAYVTHDFFWGPYRDIAVDTGRELRLFETYDAHGDFNVPGLLDAAAGALADNGRVLIILNTPCNNPTGISLTGDGAQQLRKGLNDLAADNPGKPIFLLVDGAYWEFGTDADNQALLDAFQDLPENLVFCYAFTISKSLTRYGMRTGALYVSAASQRLVDTIGKAVSATVRSTWSNTNRMGQAMFSTIFRDKDLLARVKAEQAEMTALCNSRGEQFIKEADAVGLPHTPYHGGFFATLPTAQPQAVADALADQDQIFLVPLGKGVRVAFCSIPTQQIAGLAERIAQRFH